MMWVLLFWFWVVMVVCRVLGVLKILNLYWLVLSCWLVVGWMLSMLLS